jgi:predicted nucleic-acid-binding protein
VAALDTNTLIRFLVEDDARQLAAAKRLIRKCIASGESLYVPITVALELEWVLRAGFGFDKLAVVHTMSQLLSSVELSFESEGAVESALILYGRGSADFSDCLHVALASAAGQQPLWTFDKAASKVSGAQLLSA